MAVAKNSKVPTAKKGSAKTAAASEVKIVESPPRVSRRNAPVKTAVASPSPSPSRLKSSKKKSKLLRVCGPLNFFFFRHWNCLQEDQKSRN